MNLAWHIFKKDFFRLRFALGLLVVMVGVEILLNLRLLSSAATDDRWYGAAEMYANLLTVILRLVVYILIASLVLDDPLLGTKKMFWVTRPISGGRLLRAKLIGLVLLFFVLPFVLRLPWWLYCGFGWKDLGAMALIEFAGLILIAVPAVALASLSGESSKFLLYSLLLLVANAVTFALEVVRIRGMDPDLMGSRTIVASSLALIGGIVVSVWLYLTRRFMAASVFVAIVTAMVAWCAYCWPWSLENLRFENQKQLVGTEKISVEIMSAKVDFMGKGSQISSDYATLKLRFKNMPDDLVPLSGTAEVEFSWPDGTVIRPKRVSLGIQGGIGAVRHLLELPTPTVDAETAAKNKELESRPLTPMEVKTGKSHALTDNSPKNGSLIWAQMPVTPEQARRLESGYSSCTIAVRVELARPELLLEVPLKEGVEQVGSGLRLHLLALEEEQQNKRVEADGRLTHGFWVTVVNAHAPTNDPEWFVVNRRYGAIGRMDSYRSSMSMPLLIAIRRQLGYVPVPQFWRTDKWIDAPDYLAGSTLVAVTNRNVGGFNCEVRTDHLEMNLAKAP